MYDSILFFIEMFTPDFSIGFIFSTQGKLNIGKCQNLGRRATDGNEFI